MSPGKRFQLVLGFDFGFVGDVGVGDGSVMYIRGEMCSFVIREGCSCHIRLKATFNIRGIFPVGDLRGRSGLGHSFELAFGFSFGLVGDVGVGDGSG